jgi:hypothetical protein
MCLHRTAGGGDNKRLYHLSTFQILIICDKFDSCSNIYQGPAKLVEIRKASRSLTAQPDRGGSQQFQASAPRRSFTAPQSDSHKSQGSRTMPQTEPRQHNTYQQPYIRLARPPGGKWREMPAPAEPMRQSGEPVGYSSIYDLYKWSHDVSLAEAQKNEALKGESRSSWTYNGSQR